MTQDVTAGFKLIGVRSVRSHDLTGALDMKLMYPDRSKDPTLQSSYNFTSGSTYSDYSSDAAVSAINDNGFSLYLRIWDSAAGLVEPTATTPTASERANWVKAVVEVVRHYQEGKWNGFTNLVTYVEIGNEPDSKYFWPSIYTKEEFYALYSDTAIALRAAFPTLKIGGPGVTKSGYQAGIGQQWTRGFLDYVKSKGAPLDFFSWHTYSNTPEDFTTGASFYQTELNNRGFTNTEQHVTEFHTTITASNDPSLDSANIDTRTMGKGAALITATWINLQQSGIKQAFIYRANDPSPVDHQRYGLFATDGTARRTALAFSLWSEFSGYTSRIDPSASATVSGIKALAAQRSDGSFAVLVANTGSTSASWTLAFFDTRSLPNYSLSLKTVDDTHSAVSVSTPASTSIDITPNSVQLLLGSSVTVVEFYNTNLDNYFITANAGEATAIDGGSAGPGWSRTGNTFKSGGSTSVCRFYGSMSPGPNSHFYTADAGECDYLKQLQATTPDTEKRWNFESLDFMTTLPTVAGINGACPTGTTPVYRAYNNGFAHGVDANHRIASSQAAIQQEVARGWNDEGVAMCAPQ